MDSKDQISLNRVFQVIGKLYFNLDLAEEEAARAKASAQELAAKVKTLQIRVDNIEAKKKNES